MDNTIPISWRLTTAIDFIDSLDERSCYGWIGYRTGGYFLENTTRGVFIDPYRGMMMGKRITQSDSRVMIRRIEWESGKVFDPYDDMDGRLFEKDFYVIIDGGTFHHVFKCLDNAGGSPSLNAPNISDVSVFDEAYYTADGYQWKYMFSVPEADVDRFATLDFFPVVANTAVESSAVPGSIDVIKIETAGLGYANHLTGSFSVQDVRVGGNTLVYSLQGNTSANNSNGFYTGCVMTITSGTGAGQFQEVTSYVSNSFGKFVVLESEFMIPPTNGSGWELTPAVRIMGSGKETEQAVGRAIINASANSIGRIEILDRGRDYEWAQAEIVANSVVSPTPAYIRPVYSPQGGHGSNPAEELGGTRASLSMIMFETESNTVPVDVTFDQIGLMLEPTFSNVVVSVSNTVGSFMVGEDMVLIETLPLAGTVEVSDGSSSITGTGTVLTSLKEGDQVYLSEGLNHQLAAIQSVSNNTLAQLTSNSMWSGQTSDIALAKIKNSARISQANTTALRVNHLTGQLPTGSMVIGAMSGAIAEVEKITRSGTDKGLDTFVQLTLLRGTVNSGDFTPGEMIFQGISLAEASSTAVFHSYFTDGVSDYLYVSEQIGEFSSAESLYGSESGAVFSIDNKYEGEVSYGSGKIIYVENVSPTERKINQGETLNFMLEF